MKRREIFFLETWKIGFFAACLALVCGLPPVHAQTVGSDSGKTISRFESLRFGTVRMRRGPGVEHSIAWLYKREGLPIQILREYQDWRQVRDAEGETGWIKRTQLSPARYGLVRVPNVLLRRDPDPDSRVIAKVEAGVVLKLRECSLDWCEASARGYRGWIAKDALWGVFAEEIFDDS